VTNHRRANLFRAAADAFEKGTFNSFFSQCSHASPEDLSELIQFLKGIKSVHHASEQQAVQDGARSLREMARCWS